MVYQKKDLKRDIITTIKRLGISSGGIGYYKKEIISIPNTLPDEVVVVKIIKTHPGYIEGELVRIKEKSSDWMAFPDKADPEIGGLELAHLSYDEQLEFKRDIVLESLRRYHPCSY